MIYEVKKPIFRIIEVDTPGMGRIHMLADEHGETIKGQTALSLNHHVDDLSTVTVTFLIDGQNIKVGRD